MSTTTDKTQTGEWPTRDGGIIHRLTHTEPEGWPDAEMMEQAHADEPVNLAVITATTAREMDAALAPEPAGQDGGHSRELVSAIVKEVDHDVWKSLFVESCIEDTEEAKETVDRLTRKINEAITTKLAALRAEMAELLRVAREFYTAAVIVTEPESTEDEHFRFIVARDDMRAAIAKHAQ